MNAVEDAKQRLVERAAEAAWDERQSLRVLEGEPREIWMDVSSQRQAPWLHDALVCLDALTAPDALADLLTVLTAEHGAGRVLDALEELGVVVRFRPRVPVSGTHWYAVKP